MAVNAVAADRQRTADLRSTVDFRFAYRGSCCADRTMDREAVFVDSIANRMLRSSVNNRSYYAAAEACLMRNVDSLLMIEQLSGNV